VSQNSEIMGGRNCGSDGLNVCLSKRETTGLLVSVARCPRQKGENGIKPIQVCCSVQGFRTIFKANKVKCR